MKIEPFKIRVTSKQSEIIQKILITNGIDWAYNQDKISHLDNPYLYCAPMCKKFYITSSKFGSEILFNKKTIPELTFDEFINLYSE